MTVQTSVTIIATEEDSRQYDGQNSRTKECGSVMQLQPPSADQGQTKSGSEQMALRKRWDYGLLAPGSWLLAVSRARRWWFADNTSKSHLCVHQPRIRKSWWSMLSLHSAETLPDALPTNPPISQLANPYQRPCKYPSTAATGGALSDSLTACTPKVLLSSTNAAVSTGARTANPAPDLTFGHMDRRICFGTCFAWPGLNT
ncbi:hypothetical protein N431DRAFT_462446 [Stipitochalara longipes BDJ]|nr:hypothetical protein N431DRAFT_462446 [Stipitochalara longipes BDJ]